jgi:hypothetical protein
VLGVLLVTFVATGFLFARSLRREEADHLTQNDSIAPREAQHTASTPPPMIDIKKSGDSSKIWS